MQLHGKGSVAWDGGNVLSKFYDSKTHASKRKTSDKTPSPCPTPKQRKMGEPKSLQDRKLSDRCFAKDIMFMDSSFRPVSTGPHSHKPLLINVISKTTGTHSKSRLKLQQRVIQSAGLHTKETPYFQRVTVGEETDSGSADDLQLVCDNLVKAMIIRNKYMTMSHQESDTTSSLLLEQLSRNKCVTTDDKLKILEESRMIVILPAVQTCDSLATKTKRYFFQMVHGVVQIYSNKTAMIKKKPINYPFPDLENFLLDQNFLSNLISNGPILSFSLKRLNYLLLKFQLHILLNDYRESTEQKDVPSRDFYNIVKVDTHVHGVSSMTPKRLLSFVNTMLNKNGDDIVYITSRGKHMSLTEVLASTNIDATDISVDTLDVQADRQTFQRFDKFNSKFDLMGSSLLREVFLKTDNFTNGRYFAQLLKEVLTDLECKEYQYAEYRLSIYGRSPDEWRNLAKWAISNAVHSSCVRWLIQVPRIYDIHKKNDFIQDFQQLLQNLFLPLFEVTANPDSDPDLHSFLKQVSGFDSVDDESKVDGTPFNKDSLTPDCWDGEDNPPYEYYLYYMFANIVALNYLRSIKGLTSFSFRPHCGEAGSVSHLISGYMTSQNISHGILLKESPVLQLLFYLNQIGISMSPQSNNALFLKLRDHPFYDLHARGLLVTLSTDDPLQFHLSEDPLAEEYATAKQMWSLTNVDLCELAQRSVMISSYPAEMKKDWLGDNFARTGPAANDIKKSNVPNIRVSYRFETLLDEQFSLFQRGSSACKTPESSKRGNCW